MKVEVQWKKLVKPLVPTPSDRQKWMLTSMDELQMPNYVGVIFYYRDNAENPGGDMSRTTVVLSTVMTLGVEFVHAKVDGQIDQLLHGDPDMDLLDHLSQFPANIVGNPLVVIQVNTFKCGGSAVALRSTHKIGDVYTMAMFIN
ncbi:hypothetical protein NL676_038640 [Syzygium grande]|nr:hypothetical protein NL676_038640 [Syzygium grande]